MGGDLSLPIVSENISSSWNTVASFRFWWGEAIDGTCQDNVLSGGLSDKREGSGHPTMRPLRVGWRMLLLHPSKRWSVLFECTLASPKSTTADVTRFLVGIPLLTFPHTKSFPRTKKNVFEDLCVTLKFKTDNNTTSIVLIWTYLSFFQFSSFRRLQVNKL